MRLKDSKADRIIAEYLKAMNDFGDEYASAKLSSGILRGLIEFKDISDRRSRVKNRKIMHEWDKFLGSSEFIDIKCHGIMERSINEKKKWYYQSMTKLDSKFYLSNPDQYISSHMDSLYKAFEKLKEEDVVAINRERKSQNQTPITLNEIAQIITSKI